MISYIHTFAFWVTISAQSGSAQHHLETTSACFIDMNCRNDVIAAAKKATALPAEDYNNHVRCLRDSEYPQLKDTTYLDHAGTTLYANSLIDAVARDLKTNLFGNPHSASPSSHLSSVRIDGVRSAFLEYLNADPEHFDIIFTANATAAIKLVVNGFREQIFRYYYHKDAHTSLVSIREEATAGAYCFASDQEVEEWLENGDMTDDDTIGLFAYPAQSNMTGYRPPISWCDRLRKSTCGSHRRMYSLLDAASYLTTGRLDLCDPSHAPDFISLSFYKIFGFPDLGALVVKKQAAHILTSRKYFGGGTVDMIIAVGDEWHAMRQGSFHEVLEDGTLPFHTIPAIEHALNVQKQLYGNASQISKHVSRLSASLYQMLTNLRHHNDTPVIEVYKEAHANHGDAMTQGPIIAFNVRRADGTWVGKSHFENLAIACNIQMRSGGVCNPGGIATMLKLEPWKMRRNYSEGMRCGDDLDIIGGQPTGILRVSLGAMSTEKDIETFVRFVEYFFVEKTCGAPTPAHDSESAESKTQIIPIEGCSPVDLPHSDQQSQKAVYEAWSLFHNDWCIIDRNTLQPLKLTEILKTGVRICLVPEDGVLIVTLAQSVHHVDSYFAAESPAWSLPAKLQHGLLTPSEISTSPTTCCQRTSLSIDLWDPPPQRKEASRTQGGRVLDPYHQPEIANFFSRIADLPCTLARYRPRSGTNTSQVCGFANCRVELANKDELKLHYEQHARAFNEFDLEMSGTGVSACFARPYPNTKAVENASKSSWMKRHFALKTRIRAT